MRRCQFVLVLAMAAVVEPHVARADQIDVPASTASKFASSGQHNYPFDTNYLAGTVASNDTFRNYFIFNLAAVPTNHVVTAAELFLDMPLGGYLSPDPSETFALFDVSTPAAAFGQSYSAGNAAAQAIYADLGTGTTLGSVSVSDADNGGVVSLTFSPAGINWINQAGAGTLIVGGALPTLNHGADEYELAFGFTGDTSQHVLRLTTVEVPEPAAMALAGMATAALAAAGALGRRGRSKKPAGQ